MSDDVVVRATNVSKKFCRSLKHVMYYGAEDIAQNIVGLSAHPEELRDGEFWAVNDVSFELKRGETLGIIGPNGSGKSTMLKMLNGIYMPDKGKIEIKGRVGALIEVGAGFHPMLSGRENIYVNGTILGMSKKEIDKKFDEIVKFADIGDFIDSPVKHYSNGMYVRLGFSVAIHCEPDILLIDEVLSVGDIGFQNKCYEQLIKMKDEYNVIFVSHNLASVSRFCDEVLWLNMGTKRMHGEPQEIIREYSIVSMRESIQDSNFVDANRTISGDLYIEKIELCGGNDNLKDTFTCGDDLIIRLYYNAKKDLGKPFFLINISAQNVGVIFGACMMSDGIPRKRIYPGRDIVECRFKKIPLEAGVYYININVIPETMMGKIYRQRNIKCFEVREDKKTANSSLPNFFCGVVKVPHDWEYIKK